MVEVEPRYAWRWRLRRRTFPAHGVMFRACAYSFVHPYYHTSSIQSASTLPRPLAAYYQFVHITRNILTLLEQGNSVSKISSIEMASLKRRRVLHLRRACHLCLQVDLSLYQADKRILNCVRPVELFENIFFCYLTRRRAEPFRHLCPTPFSHI